jgi:hypothetical protein
MATAATTANRRTSRLNAHSCVPLVVGKTEVTVKFPPVHH